MTARNASGAPACDTVEVARALVRGERGAVRRLGDVEDAAVGARERADTRAGNGVPHAHSAIP